MPLAQPLQQIDRTSVLHRGRELIYFGGCDYYRLASHPAVLQALRKGAEKFGLNVAASRSTTGNHVIFGRLEKQIAAFFSAERAALFSNGYVTNLAFTQTFSGRFTRALIDERSHASLRDAAAFLNCRLIAFRHRNATDLSQKLKSLGRNARALVLTDGMFSHDGSIAPLRDYLDVMPARAVLLVDDAHAAGVLGKKGGGTPEVCGVRDERVVQTISLSKAFGVYGGAVLASTKLIEAIQQHSRIFNGNTPLPLPLANAALTSLRLLKVDASLRARLHANTMQIKRALSKAGLAVADNESPIVPVMPRSARHASRLSDELLRAGIYPSLIRYAASKPFFRFVISSEHTPRQLDTLAAVLIRAAA